MIFGSFTSFNEQKKVAVKRKQLRNHLGPEAKILQEIQNSSSFEYLIRCYDIHGDVADPDYVVLEDFGQDLRAFYDRDVSIRSIFVKEILNALNAFHQLGYMHGDIKPDNILVSPSLKCKLCDFDNSVKIQPGVVSLFPRTSDGKLRFSEHWVCREVYRAFTKEERRQKSKNKVDLPASFEIDIFSVALVIDLLCRRHISPNETENNALYLTRYFEDVQELPSLSYCVRTNHPYSSYIQEMLSFDPKKRRSVHYYLDILQNFSQTGVYRQLLAKQNELELAKEFQTNLKQFMDESHSL